MTDIEVLFTFIMGDISLSGCGKRCERMKIEILCKVDNEVYNNVGLHVYTFD